MPIDGGTIESKYVLDLSDFTGGLDSAAGSLSDFAAGGTATMNPIESAFKKAGTVIAGLKLGEKILEIGQDVITTGMDFDAQMSRVQAISGATEAEFEQLRAAAIQMGADSVFGATDAAQALEYMGMAGWDAEQMMAGLPGVINLAAASGENLGTVSDIVTDALTAFGLQAGDAAHFADVLAAASSASNTDVGMMGETFKYVAPLAGALGYSVEDMAVAIGLMANSGIKAGQAGTALRGAISSLSKPSKEASDAMKRIGLSLTDSNGEMKSMDELMQNLRSSFSGLTEAEQIQYASTIFGQEAMSGMLAIINASDADYQKLTKSINESSGATERMAGVMLDNLEGDIEGFSGAIESVSLALSDFLTPAIREGVQFATGLVDKFNALDTQTKNNIFSMGGVAAAAGPLLTLGGKALTLLSGVNPLLLIFGAAASLAYTHSDTLQGAVASLSEGVSSFITTLTSGAGIGEAFSAGLTAAFGEEVTATVLGATATIQAGITTASEAIGVLTDGMGTFLGAVFDGEGLTSAWNGAVSVITAYDWTALGTTILTGITTTLDSAGTWLSSLFSAGLTALSAIDWSSVGTAILSGVTTALDVGGTWLNGLFSAGLSALSTIDWSSLGTAILSGVTTTLDVGGTWLSGLFSAGLTALSAIDWNTVGLAIHTGITGTLDAAGTFLSGLFEAGKTAIGAINWGEVGTTILSGVGTVLDSAGAFLSGLFGLGKEAAASLTWGDIGTAIFNGVLGVIDAAGAWLSGLFEAGKTALGSIDWGPAGTAILGGVTSALDTAGAWLSGLFEAGKTAVGNIEWESVGTSIKTGVETVLDTAGSWLSAGFEAAKTAISGIDWSSVGSVISTGISGAIDGLAKLGSGIWDAITGWFGGDDEETAKGDAKTSGSAMSDSMAQGITASTTSVTTAATDAATAALTAASGVLTVTSGSTITTTWMSGMTAGITTGQTTLTAQATTTGNAAVNAASMAMTYLKGSTIGANIIYGMAAGVRNTAGSLYSAITSVARTAVSRAKSTLKINSPSGVFADEVGAWIPGGIGMGVTKNMQDALGPLEEVRRSMTDVFDAPISARLGKSNAPWSHGAYQSAGVVNINITGDWTVRSDADRDAIIDELYERISEERRRT